MRLVGLPCLALFALSPARETAFIDCYAAAVGRMGQRLVSVVRRGLILTGATRSMAELAACEPFYAAPSGGTTAASYAHQAHAPSGFHEYTLVAKRDAGRDSKLLTFALPETMPTLGASVISGVKVKQEVAGEQLDKSYSPTRVAASCLPPRRRRDAT